MAHLSDASVAQITAICDRYANEKTPLMMILSDIQKEYGYIPLEVQELVSKKTGISVSEIYGVVTFYSFFSLKPKGKYVVGVCLGTACYVKGAQQVIDKFSELLGVAPGETTEDGMFTLDALRCIGACGIAPAVSINGKVYPKSCSHGVWVSRSIVSDSATPWTAARQAPLSMGFSRQEYWSGLLCLTLGYLPNPGIEPASLTSPALSVGFFTTSECHLGSADIFWLREE